MDDIPAEHLNFMLNRKFARGMAQKHTRARRRLQKLSPTSESRGHGPVQYARAVDNRIAELRLREPHPLGQDFWKLKWLKATVIFLRELGLVPRTEEETIKQLETQFKDVSLQRLKITSKLAARERRERAMLLRAAQKDKKDEVDVKIEKLDQPSTSTAIAITQDRGADHPPRNPSTPAPMVRRVEQVYTRLRKNLRKIRLAVSEDQRAGQRIRDPSRVRQNVGRVKYLSKSAAAASRRPRRKARLSRSLPSTSVSTATHKAAQGLRWLQYAHRAKARTLSGIRGKLVRRVRLLQIRLTRQRRHENSYERILAHRRHADGRAKEALWTSMRATASPGGLPVLAPTSRRRLQAQKLIESVREYLLDEEPPVEYREGEYKPLRSGEMANEHREGEHEPFRSDQTSDEHTEDGYKPFGS